MKKTVSLILIALSFICAHPKLAVTAATVATASAAHAQFSYSYNPSDSTWTNLGGWSLKPMYIQKDSISPNNGDFFKHNEGHIYMLKYATRNDGQAAKALYVDGSTGEVKQGNIPATSTTSIVSTSTLITISGSSPNYSITSKRQEKYTGTTSAAGTYTVNFATAYSTAPDIQASWINAADNQNLRITAISSTGFTVLARNRVDVVGLLPTWTNVSGATINVIITER